MMQFYGNYIAMDVPMQNHLRHDITSLLCSASSNYLVVHTKPTRAQTELNQSINIMRKQKQQTHKEERDDIVQYIVIYCCYFYKEILFVDTVA
jgi:hypothetical protein